MFTDTQNEIMRDYLDATVDNPSMIITEIKFVTDDDPNQLDCLTIETIVTWPDGTRTLYRDVYNPDGTRNMELGSSEPLSSVEPIEIPQSVLDELHARVQAAIKRSRYWVIDRSRS